VIRRILLLITDLEIGGTPTVVRELALRLNDPPRVKVEVACLSHVGPVAHELRAAKIPVTCFNAKGVRNAIGTLVRLNHHIRYGRFDTVVSFLIHANVMAALARVFVRDVRYVQSIQTTQPHPRWHWRMQRLARHAAERIVVPSPSVAQVARERSRVAHEQIAIIPNAIDAEQFRVPRRPRDGGPPVVGFLGRLDPIKRVPDLLRAVQELGGRVRLAIFGDGAERPHIVSEISRLNIADHVTLHGAVARPQDALAQIDLLVLPSMAEGFGLVLIEAMAAGVPVVATNVAGIRDVVVNGETGVLVPPGDPDELAVAIEKVLGNSTLRHRLVSHAAKDVRERFTWDAVMPQYRALLGIPEKQPEAQGAGDASLGS
jgi:glycosyltransferase involved in cell wall biosynthesis